MGRVRWIFCITTDRGVNDYLTGIGSYRSRREKEEPFFCRNNHTKNSRSVCGISPPERKTHESPLKEFLLKERNTRKKTQRKYIKETRKHNNKHQNKIQDAVCVFFVVAVDFSSYRQPVQRTFVNTSSWCVTETCFNLSRHSILENKLHYWANVPLTL